MSSLEHQHKDYKTLLDRIADSYESGQRSVAQAVNAGLLQTYWEIGRHIVEFEQEGKATAEYGKRLLERLSADLSALYGKGFSRSNLNHMRQLFRCYPICEKLSHKLSWSHYVELLKIDDPLERGFYEKQSLLENWTVRELVRQERPSFSPFCAAHGARMSAIHNRGHLA